MTGRRPHPFVGGRLLSPRIGRLCRRARGLRGGAALERGPVAWRSTTRMHARRTSTSSRRSTAPPPGNTPLTGARLLTPSLTAAADPHRLPVSLCRLLCLLCALAPSAPGSPSGTRGTTRSSRRRRAPRPSTGAPTRSTLCRSVSLSLCRALSVSFFLNVFLCLCLCLCRCLCLCLCLCACRADRRKRGG